MQLTLNIDLKNAKAVALLNYIRTLDFISVEEKQTISEVQKRAIDVGIDALEQGRSYQHQEVMEETKKRYPNLFR